METRSEARGRGEIFRILPLRAGVRKADEDQHDDNGNGSNDDERLVTGLLPILRHIAHYPARTNIPPTLLLQAGKVLMFTPIILLTLVTIMAY